MKIFITLIVLIAIIAGMMAIMAVVLPHNQIIVRLIVFRDFFDVCLPILGFGALIKYLCTTRCGCGCCNKA